MFHTHIMFDESAEYRVLVRQIGLGLDLHRVGIRLHSMSNSVSHLASCQGSWDSGHDRKFDPWVVTQNKRKLNIAIALIDI